MKFAFTNATDDLKGASVVIWTTTPWTIPSNKAVAYNPKIAYALYEVVDAHDGNWARIGEKYVLARDLAEGVFKSANVDEYKELRTVSADELGGLECKHPLADLDPFWDYSEGVPMIDGDHVTDEAGTGFVHTAPSHGADDYDCFVKRGWTDRMTHNVNEESAFEDFVPFFAGLEVFTRKGKEGKANGAVITKLVEANALIARGRVKHSYPHSWRSKAPIIFRNTPQWFVAIDKDLNDGMDQHGKTIRQRALTEIDNVKWTPQSGRNRLHSMIENRPDWVMSRQRAWGVPLSCFIKHNGDGTVEILRDAAVNARIAAAFREEGADAWFADGARERFLEGVENADQWELVSDILDVWFDSGSTHAFVVRDRPDGSPDGVADLYLEGTDQHRGWFHSSLLQSVATKGCAPYKGVLTHGFTLDAKGMKMSKSVGNTIAPEKVIKQYGADILRLWVAQSDYTADLRIGDEILKGVSDSYRRLRNTMRFMLGALGEYDGTNPVNAADMPELERWVLHRLAELDNVVRKGYAAYDFQGVFQAIFTFATIDLSSFYFDIRKDALYCDGADSLNQRAALSVLDIVYDHLTKWLAPILSFTMEEIWLERHPGDDSSVHLEDLPDTPSTWLDADLAAKWAGIRAVRRVVTGAIEVERTAKNIGASLEAAPVVYVDAATKAVLDGVDFADICITSQVVVTADTPPSGAFVLPEDSTSVVFAKAEGEKCQRCWKILPDVGAHNHKGVCGRCDGALD